MKKRFGQYPYTATRVKVMKSELLSAPDYQRLYEMGYNEIARTLEEGAYRDDINTLAGTHKGIELIELALNANFARTVDKLLTISHKKEVKDLITRYCMKWVLGNYKLLLKVKLGIASAEDVQKIFIPIPPTNKDDMQRLLKAEPHEVVREIADYLEEDRKAFIRVFDKKDITKIENRMDKLYFRRLMQILQQVKIGKKDPLHLFIRDSIVLTNLKTIVRLKAKGIHNDRILLSLVAPGLLEKELLKQATPEAVLKSLKGTRYHSLDVPHLGKDLSLLENATERFQFRMAYDLLHKRPLSVGTIFGFLLLKEIEVRNLRIFIHAKALNLGKDFIDQTIVVE